MNWLDLSWLGPEATSAALAAMLNHGCDWIEIVDPDGTLLFASPLAIRSLGEDSGAAWLDSWPERTSVADAFARACNGDTATLSAAIRTGKNTEIRLDMTLVPLGEAAPVLALCRDITQHYLAEARNRTLVIDMQHRVKNALAVVQALATQTLRRAEDTATASEVLTGRIAALASAQELLAPERWSDCTVATVATRVAEPYDPTRFNIDGPALALTPRACVALWIALHELCTNAVKFGALACEAGRIRLDWSVDETAQRLNMRWQEQGGPAVMAPTTTGFGTRLIRDALAAEFGGTVTIDYAPVGLDVAIMGKLGRIIPARDQS
jgi:two-component sensor histidine kinase